MSNNESFPGYKNIETIYLSPRTGVYRAQSEELGNEVLLKVCNMETPPIELVQSYRNEFQRAQQIQHPRLLKAHTYTQFGDRPAIVLEAFFGQSLAEVLQKAPLDIKTFFKVATAITETLSFIHQKGWIHRDVKPGNILLGENGDIRLIDYALMTPLHSRLRQEHTVGTLGYLPPEQTGRVNRLTDQRSDLYALGVSFFEMLTGEMPFTADDDLALIHAHLALEPRKLSQLGIDLKVPLDNLIEKLLKKDPGERYQSARGLLYDLKTLEASLENPELLKDFSIGEQDVSETLRHVAGLYGRQQTLDELVKIVSQVEKQKISQACLISGDAGVGKSYLIAELKRKLNQIQVFKVRAEKERCHRPFQVLLDLLGLVIDEGRASGRQWEQEFKEKVESLMMPHLSSLCDLIPALAKIWPGVKTGERHENTERISQQLVSFLEILIMQKPMVFVIDEMNFCDKESQFVIESIVNTQKGTGFFIGLSETSNKKDFYFTKPLQHIEFPALSHSDLKEYLKKACGEEAPSDIILMFYEKTGGNLYALEQLVDAINKNGWAKRDEKNHWIWDRDAINQVSVSENVARGLMERLNQLSPQKKKCLGAAACLGLEFNSSEVQGLLQCDDAFLVETLSEFTDLGLVHSLNGLTYHFSHEKVRQELLDKMNSQQREHHYYQIAKKQLHKKTLQGLSRDLKQSLADQVIASGQLFSEEAELAADACYQAAESLFSMAAFEKAIYYTKKGLFFCEKGFPKIKNKLSRILVESLFRMGQIKESEELVKELLQASMPAVERARLLLIACFIYQAQGRFEKVMKMGLEAMALIGSPAPLRPNGLHLIFAIIKTERYRKKLAKGKVKPQPWEHTLLSHELRAAIGKAAYFSNKKLYALMSIQGAYESLSTGHEMPTALTPYAVILSGKLGRYDEGNELVRKAFENSDKSKKTTSVIYSEHLHRVIYRIFIRVWMTPLSGLVEDLKDLYQKSRKLGDPMSISTSALYLGAYQIQQGFPLDTIADDMKDYKNFIHYHKDQVLIDDFESVDLFYKCLKGETPLHQFSHIDGRSEKEFIAYLHKHISPNPAAFWGYQKLQYSCLLGLDEDAKKALPLSEKCEEAIPFSLGFAMHLFFKSLYILSSWSKLSFWQRFKTHFFIRKTLRKFHTWSELEPSTFRPYLYLLEAELARLRRLSETRALSFYEKAYEGAKNIGNLMLQGLALEKATDFALSRDVRGLAQSYFEKSLSAYELWGSPVKVQQMKSKYSELCGLSSGLQASEKLSRVSKNSTLMGASLDLEAIMKASHVIASEIEMGPLNARLVQTLVESAGATQGALFHTDGGELRLLSQCSYSPDGQHCIVEVDNLDKTLEEMPLCFVRRVLNKGEIEVLDNINEHQDFKNHGRIQWRSVLCIPITTSRGFSGVALLNNDKADGFFTPDHVETLRVLSSQAAISIQNAQLHEETKEKMRMQGELETASQVQSTLMPQTHFESEQVLIHGSYEPASECGGDWWYYNQLGDKLILCIGDATGHGVSAALITSAVRSGVKVMEDFSNLPVNEVLSRLNNVIHLSTRGDVLMTFFMASLDLKTGRMDYCNASHTSPYFLRGGKVECLLSDPSPILGRQHNSKYRLYTHEVLPGDDLIFFTDGLTELYNPEGDMWGEQALVRLMRKIGRSGLEKDLLDEIKRASSRFQQKAPLADDVTYFSLRLKSLLSISKKAA